MNLLTHALELVLIYYGHQTDKVGKPYFLHLVRVMLAVEGLGEEHMIVGLLHDLIEDTCFSLVHRNSEHALEAYGFGEVTAKAIDAITHRKGEPYQEYLERVKANHIALAVKLADIQDNLREDRLELLPIEERWRLREKYSKALDLLNGHQVLPGIPFMCEG